MIYQFTIPGHPRVFQSFRFTKSGDKYPPSGKLEWQEYIRLCARPCAPQEPINDFVSVEISAWIQRPKKTHFRFPPRIDLDNFSKALLDALQGVIYTNDKFVARELLSKQWADEPLTIVRIEEL